MTKHYILEDREPIEVSDVLTWARWFETADRIVKLTTINEEIRISTVFLGLDHQFRFGGPPLLFETMIFGGKRDGAQWRYSTWDEAMAGHNAAVNRLGRPPLGRLFQWLRRS